MEAQFEAMGFLLDIDGHHVFDTRECAFSDEPSDDNLAVRLQRLALMKAAGDWVPLFLSASTGSAVFLNETVITRDDDNLIIEVLGENSEITENYVFDIID